MKTLRYFEKRGHEIELVKSMHGYYMVDYSYNGDHQWVKDFKELQDALNEFNRLSNELA